MTDYPQHDKLKALGGANQTVGDFVEWLGENGYAICKRHKPTLDNEWQEYWPTFTTRDALIAQFFDIDERELSHEKDRMLDEFRRRQDEERMTG